MNKLLWIGDAGCDSGFAKATHNTLSFLRFNWEVYVLGLNYRGDPHTLPYRVFPAYVYGCEDFLGTQRLREIIDRTNPDVIVIQNDPWHFPRYEKEIAKLSEEAQKIPRVYIVAIDGKNCLGTALNTATHCIFWSQFGKNEAERGGYIGPGTVIPLGVDLNIYTEKDYAESRKAAGLPEYTHDQFLIGNVNRNQPRKRLDLTVQYFAEWVKEYRVDNSQLLLHICPTGEFGYNCGQLMRYYGLKKRLIISEPGVWQGLSEEDMSLLYSCMDLQITTTLGEGFGLPTLEGMACGIPQIVPDWSALGEWTYPAAYQVPCTSTQAHVGSFNHIGGVADKQDFIGALNDIYRSAVIRRSYSELGLQIARRPEYRWSNIALKVGEVLEGVLAKNTSHLQATL